MEAAILGSITVAARDPGSTRVVYGIVIGLVVLGVGLVALTWWLVRTTRPDPELLAPLEAIQTRRWRRLDPADQRRMLDELRPDGAEPVAPAPKRPDVDDEFASEPVHRDVRELADPDRRRLRRFGQAVGAAGLTVSTSSGGGSVVGEVGLARRDADEPDDADDADGDDGDDGDGDDGEPAMSEEVAAVWGAPAVDTAAPTPGPAEPESGDTVADEVSADGDEVGADGDEDDAGDAVEPGT